MPDERVLADGGYTGEERIWAKGNSGYQNVTSIMEGTARARHETVNRLFKNVGVLKQPFRHELSLHTTCFYAVANLVQLMIKFENPVFMVTYYEM